MSSKDEGSEPKKRRKRHGGFEEWGGYMNAKKTKLAAQFNREKPAEFRDEQKSEIFKGVSIFVNGYTNPGVDELKRLMLIHGGTYHHYYSRSKTTHIIASNLPHSKIQNLKNENVVTTKWITDSIKTGKLLPFHDYLLYTPETKDKQQRLHFNSIFEQKLDDCPTTSSTNLMINLKTSTNNCDESKLSESENFISGDSPPLFENAEFDQPAESEKNVHLKSETLNIKPSTSHIGHIEAISDTSLSPHKLEPAIKAGHPEFLSEFYSHSRLHHISTAGQELKLYVQKLAENNNGFPGREKLKNLPLVHDLLSNDELLIEDFRNSNKTKTAIMHLDMDCFFVSVGLRKHPELRGCPVAVTHSKGKRGGPQKGSDINYEYSHYENISEKKIKGLTTINEDDDFVSNESKPKPSIYSKEYGSLSEIASCSYEARKAGVRNGMFLGEALRRCPNLKTIPYDFEGYSEVSKQLYDIVASYTLEIEAISCDELYIDCSDLLRETNVSPYQFASTLRAEIKEKTNCTASAGLGSNMLLARLANKVAKPNGQYYVLDSEIEEFMKNQDVEDLPGVGYRTSKRLEQMNIMTCKDLQSITLPKLQQEFGPKTGESLYNKCRGKDNRTVQLQKNRKSVSAEINYGIRFETNEDVNKFINELAVEVESRLKKINSKGKAITLKLMARKSDAPLETAKFMGHGVCDNLSKSVILKCATNSSKLIGSECCMLARAVNIKPQDFRGVGIHVSKLESVPNEKITHKTLNNFFAQPCDSSKTEACISKETYSPKKFKTAEKASPKKNTIEHFLSKPQGKLAYNLTDYVPEQLDQSVLNALPEDIRKEVLETCGKPISTNQVQNSSVITYPLVTTPTSSTKFMRKKSSNVRNNLEAADIASIISKPKRVSATVTSSSEYPIKEQVPNETLVDKCSKRVIDSGSQKKRVIDFYVTWGQNNTKPACNSAKKASLGGAVEIEEVRKLLREWIISTQNPLDEDIEELKQFLLDSIDEDLAKVSLLLKYFYRLASSHGPEWKQAYLSTLSYVQQKMLQNFGSMLNANSDFPT